MLLRMRSTWILMGLSVFLWGACTGSAPVSMTVAANKQEVAPGDKVILTIGVTNYKLVDPQGNITEPNSGFYRIFLDQKTEHLHEGFSNTAEVTLPSDLSEGEHKLRVQLLKGDKTPLNPPIEQTVTINVKGGGGAPTINVTADKTKVKPGEQITLTVDVKNFNLKPPESNTVNKKGEGHYHVSLDNDDPEQTYASLGHESTVKVTIPLSITAGPHKMHVYLMNNNHTKYSPEVKATVDFEVTQAAAPTLSFTVNKQTAAPGDTIVLDISVTNFKLTKISDSPSNKPGEGHYHVLVNDGNPEDSSKYIAADYREKLELALPKTLPTGKHKLFIYLMNNNHTKYDPETKASVDIEIVGTDTPIVNATVTNKNVKAGEEFEVKISTSNFKLTEISNSPVNKSGEGHYHVVLDDADPEKDYITPDYRETIKVKLPAATKPGAHKLHVYLMNNDHTLYKPEAKATIELNVIDPAAPAITTFTADKTNVKPGDKVEINIAVENFKLLAISNSPTNKAGEGHYHLAFDDNDPEQTYVTATHETKVTITIPSNLPAGKHKLHAYLMNNDHTKYSPEVKATIEIEVTDD